MAHKVAVDVEFNGKDVDQFLSYTAVKSVILNPQKLKQLDIENYKHQLEVVK